MTCPSYRTSDVVSLWWALDPDVDSDIPGTFTWNNLLITGEQIEPKMTSTVLEDLLPERSYSGSKLSGGEVSGSFNFYARANSALFDLLACALQSSQSLSLGTTTTVAGTSGVTISAVGTAAGDDRTVNLTGLTVTVGATYSVNIDGVDFKYTAVTNDTLALVATGLAAVIDASSSFVATSLDSTITISDGAGISVITFTSWTPATWAPGESIKNGVSTKCLALLKRVQVTDTTYDWYIFRGCQISSMSFELKSKSPVTGTCNIFGIRPDQPVTASTLPVGWTWVSATPTEVMAAADGLQDFEIRAASGLDSGLVVQDLTLNFDNQMRAQDGVGLGHIFAAGVASGKIKVTMSATVYYASPRVYNDMISDNHLSIVGSLVDPNGDGFSFNMADVKVTSGGIPLADSSGKDLTTKTEFQAWEHATYGTITLTRLAG